MARQARKGKKAAAPPSLAQLMQQMLDELERRDADEQREAVPAKR